MKAASPGRWGWSVAVVWGRTPHGLMADPPLPVPGAVGAGREVTADDVCGEQPVAGRGAWPSTKSYVASGKSVPFPLQEFCPLQCVSRWIH